MDRKQFQIFIDNPYNYIQILPGIVLLMAMPNDEGLNKAIETGSLSLSESENLIKNYRKKYDINNYKGKFSIFSDEKMIYLRFKKTVVFQMENHNENGEIPIMIIGELLFRFFKSKQVQSIAFEVRQKDFLFKLQEFTRYAMLDMKESDKWYKNREKYGTICF